jgi:hypothetical protein
MESVADYFRRNPLLRSGGEKSEAGARRYYARMFIELAR